MKDFLSNLALFGIVVSMVMLCGILLCLPFAVLVLIVWLICRIWY